MAKTKIHVTWVPGGYGSYMMQSIYAYSNLGATSNIIIDSTGSSHTFRDGAEKKKYFDTAVFGEHTNDSDVIVGPAHGHMLDYFVNEYIKQELNNLPQYFNHFFKDHKSQIDENWNNKQDWAAREWISFWILDVLNASYGKDSRIDLTTDKLFDENQDVFPAEITSIIEKLGLSVVADIDTIKTNHTNWQKQQQCNNLQKRCDEWVNEIITTNKNTPSPCITILDEAYVQSLIRRHGYEIRCFGLDTFPKTSNEIRKLLYKESANDNTT
tara:strand:- start:2196 stop:3002 length:807 start_codon:yes stop_codon:yes gene_type:complete